VTVFDLKKELEDLKELSKEKGLEEEIEKNLVLLENKIKEKEFTSFLSGKYDKGNAILTIQAGAGGQDAQDWASMLLRMYQRYCAKKGYKFVILHQSFGEGVGPKGRLGTKSATVEIKGSYAYGFLKNETGVHRLVRLSPFSAKNLRHTSFALVEVLPEIKQDSEIKILPSEIKVDTFRSSGHGGQYVNKRESAVRVTHLPTGVTVVCQSERLQGLNREKALKVLYSKLYQMKEMERQNEIIQIRGKKVSPSWGNQIRSYVLYPYKLVKDLRTKVETSNVDEVLDGDLNKFIEAEIKL
jgi:peptide chain release factor 2